MCNLQEVQNYKLSEEKSKDHSQSSIKATCSVLLLFLLIVTVAVFCPPRGGSR